MLSFRFDNLAPLWRTQARGLRLVPVILQLAPLPTAGTILLVLIAGLGESIGLAFFMPLLTSAGMQAEDSLSQVFFSVIRDLGLPPGTGTILLIIAVIFILKSGLQLWANLSIGYAGAAFSTRIRLELVRGLLNARWSVFTNQPMGALANSVATDSVRAASVVTSGLQVVAFSIQLLIFLVLSLAISWQGTIAALGGGAILFATMHYFVAMARRAGGQQQKLFERLLTRLIDQLNMVKPIKAMGAEKQFSPFLETDIHHLDGTQRQLVNSKAGLTTLNEPVVIGLLCLGAWLATRFLAMPMADFLVLAMVFYRSASRLSALQSAHQALVSSQDFLITMAQLVRRIREAAEHNTGTLQPSLSRAVRLQDVTFDYGAVPVLRDTQLTLAAGKVTALIGPSGSGKSSILDLVLGLQHPQHGKVLIDDTDLKLVDMAAWRARIGYVPQETILLNDTIRANVTLGDTSIPQADIMEALRLADAEGFVAALPDGIESGVGERGMQLSGGQRQRIALARALVRKPYLLVLDEPTSALDAESAAAFCATLRSLSGRMTVLIVSHQLDVTRASDTIYELKDGQAHNRTLAIKVDGETHLASA